MEEKVEIESVMHEKRAFKPSKEFVKKAHIKSFKQYEQLYRESIKSPSKFWPKIAKELFWFKKWKKVYYWNPKTLKCKWFEGAKTNISYNCLDRHITTWRKNKAALIWQGEPENDVKTYTYEELHREVCRFANVLKKNGLKKGNRVCIYLPMIPELAISMLACTRIGVIHSIVFGGYSAKALETRINDCKAKVLITADGSLRKGEIIPMKNTADLAVKNCRTIKKVIVVKRAANEIEMKKGRDAWWHDEIDADNIKDYCEPEKMSAEDPLFILYTSGCCHGSSLIQLTNGEIVKIKDMVDKNIKTKIINMHSNPFVQTEDNVTHFHKYPNTSLLCKVRTPSFEAIFTPNHRLFSLNEYGNLVEKEAGSLNKGDKVFVVSKINVKGEKQILPSFKRRKEYRNRTTYRPKNIPKIHNFLTPHLAQILGYLAGDGHADKRSIIFTDKDKNNLLFYQNLIKKELNLVSIIRKINRQRLLVNSSPFTDYIKKFFPEIVCKSRYRSVPKIIQKSKNGCVAGFLRGLFDAEGTVGHSFIKLSSTSEELIRLTQLLLRRLDVLSNVYLGKNKERQIENRKIKETEFLDIIISQRESLNIFYKKIGFSHEIKNIRLEELIKNLSSRKILPKERFPIFSLLKEITKIIKVDWKGEFKSITKFVYSNQTDKNGLRIIKDFLDSKIDKMGRVGREKLEKLKLIRGKIQKLMEFEGAVLEKVLEVEKIADESDFVYDLTVQKNHNYIVNGFVTHNTTGTPKGVLHTTAGYLVYVYITAKWIFDLKDKDTYWCTADIGWVTGHSYIVYGPLANGATTLMFEGVPTFPNPGRCWKIVEKFKVNIFYTAPTLIRSLEREGDRWPKKHDLSSLRLLGTVGEPINPEVWLWYYNTIGNKKCPIVDTWWQTETGGILITPLPGAMALKPGSAMRPFPGVKAAILREDGSEAKADEGGYLVIKQPWPSMERTVWHNPKRYKETYFSKFPGLYLTGDGAKIDKDGDFWLVGRIDDVIKVSGHRIGTAELESALVSHDKVAEAAVVPMHHSIKGQAPYAFVTLKKGAEKTGMLKEELKRHVAKEIGPIAKPEKIQFADALPKTRSGKIMRRILKAIVEGTEIGDTTTLADPSVVEQLLKERQQG